MFQHFSHQFRTPGRLLRLSYAIDMRYGVLHDVARKVLQREPIDLAMGHANIIWQGEANEWALRSLGALRHADFAAQHQRAEDQHPAKWRRRWRSAWALTPVLTGQEAPTAWLVDCTRAFELFGPPQVGLDRMLDWTADWVSRGGEALGKPTHYEARDGKY